MKVFVLLLVLVNTQAGRVEQVGAGTFASAESCEARAELIRNAPTRDVAYIMDAACVETELQP